MTTWFDIGVHLTVSVKFKEWREAPWLRTVICDDGEPGRIRAYRMIEAEFTEVLDAAVRQWLKDETMPELPHPASYLLALRFASLGFLLSSFDPVLPVPKPGELTSVFRRWLLDWWHKHGAAYAVGFSCAEYDVQAT